MRNQGSLACTREDKNGMQKGEPTLFTLFLKLFHKQAERSCMAQLQECFHSN